MMRFVLGAATGFISGVLMVHYYGLFSWQFWLGVVGWAVLYNAGYSVLFEE